MATTAAQDEFNDLLAKNSVRETVHPEDRNDPDLKHSADLSEEDEHRNAQIDAAMRVSNDPHGNFILPPTSFDNGRSTGVKGVIADARSYDTARKTGKWRNRINNARRSIFGMEGVTGKPRTPVSRSGSETTDDESRSAGSDTGDDDDFMLHWRESRRRELEVEAAKGIRTRRTSPSVREYGRLDVVDALGYLDATEKVGRETTVVVFVYDEDCEVSAMVEAALRPLVATYRAVHFVKIHYDDVDFDPAATPSILAYRNQGDLVANLTGIIELIPDDETFGADSLRGILQRFGVL